MRLEQRTPRQLVDEYKLNQPLTFLEIRVSVVRFRPWLPKRSHTYWKWIDLHEVRELLSNDSSLSYVARYNFGWRPKPNMAYAQNTSFLLLLGLMTDNERR